LGGGKVEGTKKVSREMKTYFFALRKVPRQRPWLQHARGMCSSVAGPDYMTLKCKLMRGGTSKGLFFRRSWLPEVGVDAAFAAAMGSRDRFSRQLDGMGGGTSSTSKVAIVDAFEKESAAGGVGRRDSAGCDVSYMFGQVSVADETVDYSGTCGNLASAVGELPGNLTPRLTPPGSEIGWNVR
jgi:hypothetical protein